MARDHLKPDGSSLHRTPPQSSVKRRCRIRRKLACLELKIMVSVGTAATGGSTDGVTVDGVVVVVIV